MKFNAAFVFLPVALAAPGQPIEAQGMSEFKRDLPNLTPVNVPNFDSSFDISCGRTKIKGSQVHKAVSWGTCLQRADEVVGSNEYPHRFNNREDFKFFDDKCNDVTYRKEVPITGDGIFKGDDDDEAGKWRAIYVHDPNSSTDTQGNPTAYYCGTVYHKNNSNDFYGCDIKP